jgi:hypothetical protein
LGVALLVRFKLLRLSFQLVAHQCVLGFELVHARFEVLDFSLSFFDSIERGLVLGRGRDERARAMR